MLQNCVDIFHEIRSRILHFESSVSVIEYSNSTWVVDVHEIDNTFANGYAGLYAVCSVIPVLQDVASLISDKSSTINTLPNGFQLGDALYSYFSRDLGLEREVNISHIQNGQLLPLDVYTGSAGTLLAHILKKKSTSVLPLIFELIEKYKSAQLPFGFAHGKLGLLYSLSVAADALRDDIKLFRLLNDFVVNELKLLIENIDAEINFAVCAGEIPALFVCFFVEKVFDVPGEFSETTELILERLAKLQNQGFTTDVPLHNCCGIAGIVDVLISLYHLSEDKTHLELATGFAKTFFTQDGYSKVLSTGLFHGVAGIAYQLARIYPHLCNNRKLPSLFFPYIYKKESYD